MRLLFVVANPPSPVRVRPYELVRGLVARGHVVTVVTAARGAREAGEVRALEAAGVDVLSAEVGAAQVAANVARAVLDGVPLQMRYGWQPALAEALVARVRRAAAEGRPYDLAHVEHLRAARYGLRLRGMLPVVWDSVDSITHLLDQARRHTRSPKGRLLAALDLERTRRHEGRLARLFDAVTVTSEADRQAIALLRGGRAARAGANGAAADPGPAIHVVPNGVDLGRFGPGPWPRDGRTIVMSGKMSYHANETGARFLVEAVLPQVWQARPDAQVVLAGAEPTRALRALAAASGGRVRVTGYLEDLAPELGRAAVAAAPLLYGAGIQNKVLEAMATATPVVATPLAARALDARAGVEALFVGATAGELAEGILALLSDPDRARRVGAAGRAYVERAHRWPDAVARLEAVHAEAIDRFRREAAARRAPWSP